MFIILFIYLFTDLFIYRIQESSTVTFDELVGHSFAPLDLETISTIGGAFDSTALSSVMHMISDGHGYDSDGEPKLTILPSGAMQFMVGSSDCNALQRTSRLPALQFNQWASQSFAEQLLRPENNGPESSLLDGELLKTEVASCFHVPGHYGLLYVTAPDHLGARNISLWDPLERFINFEKEAAAFNVLLKSERTRLVDAKLPKEGSITLMAQPADLPQQSGSGDACGPVVCAHAYFRYILGRAPTRDDCCAQNEVALRCFILDALLASRVRLPKV